MPGAMRRPLLGAAAVLVASAAAWWNVTAAPQQSEATAAAEGVIHRRPGSAGIGRPAVAPEGSGRLQVKVVDADTGEPIFCRVNVVGPDGNFYEPVDNPLQPWSLERLGNREGKGPFRYYGWFFYTDGRFEVAVPEGRAAVEVWKGFEYEPAAVSVDVAGGGTSQAVVRLKRAIDMASRGWYSGDTHIHLNRRNATDDQRALDLAACEDIRFAHVLCMNDPRTYKPLMSAQIWPQPERLGPHSVNRRGRYSIASGQEYRCGTFGHICLIGGSRLVDADGLDTDPNNWPPFGLVADELHGLGGYAFHAHGGYEKEIYADFAQRATDGVELLQFAVYRGIGLEGWYHILNAGFRFPAVGASDYPYCRALGDCRTYTCPGEGEPTFATWNKAAAEGRSFFTTGPLIELEVEGSRPGETVARDSAATPLKVRVRMQSPVAPVDELQVIEGGRVIEKRSLKGADRVGPCVWTTKLPVGQSTWIACRALARGPDGLEDAEAHTNPVYVSVDGGRAFSAESLRWLLAKLDERIAFHAGRSFAERDKVLEYFRNSRAVLVRTLRERERM